MKFIDKKYQIMLKYKHIWQTNRNIVMQSLESKGCKYEVTGCRDVRKMFKDNNCQITYEILG